MAHADTPPAERTPAVPTARRILCVCYGLIALAALIATWSQNVAYLDEGLRFLPAFIDDSRVTPGARSMGADVLMLGLAAIVLMVVEARRVGVKYVWLYVVGALVTAISVTFPLFLIARELRMSAADAPRLRATDSILLAVVAVVALAWTIYIDLG
ncbi:MAG: DUF2834 domain-containing protein [Mycolicibacterium hassiacum]|jgi:hypothetical protein|nr:MAG: hypothetical protein DIU75_13205 [Mycolicibacterium hassiacum]